MEGWDGETEMEGEKSRREQRGCGWGWVSWLTGLDLAGWLPVTHNLRQGFLPRAYTIHPHIQHNTHNLHALKHIMHHVHMWKQATLYTHTHTWVYKSVTIDTHAVYTWVHNVWTEWQSVDLLCKLTEFVTCNCCDCNISHMSVTNTTGPASSKRPVKIFNIMKIQNTNVCFSAAITHTFVLKRLFISVIEKCNAVFFKHTISFYNRKLSWYCIFSKIYMTLCIKHLLLYILLTRMSVCVLGRCFA